MARDTFRDGAGILPTYEWDIGHESEDPDERSQNLERTAVTSGLGYVRQQGSPTPGQFKLKGWIRKQEQLEKMALYFNACAGIGTPARTIFYEDLTGNEYEVLILDFAPQRKIGRTPGSGGLSYVWQYSLTMEIIK